MPVSRDGNLYFTKDQYDYARYETSALEYAIEEGYQLVSDGRSTKYFHLKEHDSMLFTSDGRWFWNSYNLKGGALEFITNYESKNFVEAVLKLNNALEQDQQQKANHQQRPYQKKEQPAEEPKPFELPEKSGSFKRLFAYLCNTRYLDHDIVQDLIDQKRLYEGVNRYRDRKTGEWNKFHNAVFVGYDQEGVPRSAFQRGLNSYATTPFKGDVESSQKEIAFCVPGYSGVTKVIAFEASIDAISHASIAKMQGGDYKTADRIALGGVAFEPLNNYLNSHQDVREIVLALDNDAAGINATERIQMELEVAGYIPGYGYHISADVPTYAKDWNEVLQMMCGGNQRESETPATDTQEPTESQEDDLELE